MTMTVVIVAVVCLVAGFALGFGVCANNYNNVEKLRSALDAAKQEMRKK
jgi:hypothetical protein